MGGGGIFFYIVCEGGLLLVREAWVCSITRAGNPYRNIGTGGKGYVSFAHLRFTSFIALIFFIFFRKMYGSTELLLRECGLS